MHFSEVPAGFGLALAKNETATNIFAMMTKEEKQAVWHRARQAQSEQEMSKIISDIANGIP